MTGEIRKLVTYEEEVRIEGGRVLEHPVRLVGVAAVLANPWAGNGFTEDLKPEILRIAPVIGELLVERILQQCSGAERIEAYGKAAVVGVNGEIEHASALIHTLRFGNFYRNAVKAESYLSFTNKRGAAGSSLQIPMMHIHDAGKRSHYLTLEMFIADAPGPDEIVVALGAADGGRAHPRIGDRYSDMKELAVEQR